MAREPPAARLTSLQPIRLCRLGSFVSFAAESSARLLYVCSATVPCCYDTGVIVATVEGRRFLLETRLGYAVERTPDRGACDVRSTQHSWVIVASEARHPGGWTGARPERPSDRNGSPHVVVRVMMAHSGPPGAQYSPVTVSRPADTTLPPLLVQNREARWPNKGGSAMSRCSVPWRAATTIRAATWTYSSMGHRVLRRWHFSGSPSTPKSCLTSTWTSGGKDSGVPRYASAYPAKPRPCEACAQRRHPARAQLPHRRSSQRNLSACAPRTPRTSSCRFSSGRCARGYPRFACEPSHSGIC